MGVVRKVGGGGYPVVRKVDNVVVPPGGGGARPVSPVPDITPIVVPTSGPTPVFVSWAGASSGVLAGESVELHVVLNTSIDVPGVIPVTVVTGSTTADPAEYTLTPTEVTVPTGLLSGFITLETTALAGGSGGTVLALLLDPDEEPINESFVLQTNPTFGPDTVTVQIAEPGGGGAPASTWTFTASDPQTVQEGSNQAFVVTLDQAIPAEGRLRVYTQSTGASEPPTVDPDFIPIDEVLVFNAGSTSASFAIDFPNNDRLAPTSPTLDVFGEVVPGSEDVLVDGALTSFGIEIEDNDGGLGPVRAVWATTSRPVQEGETIPVRLELRDNAGQPTSFSSLTGITLLRTPQGGAELDVDFSEQWTAPNSELQFVFEAQQTSAEFLFTAISDTEPDEVDEAVNYRITQAPNGEYTIGGGAVTTLSIVEPGVVGGTELLFDAGPAGDRRMIQGPIAVVPPQQILPRLALSTGEEVQVVGMHQDAQGFWDLAYWYGFMDDRSSTPGEASPVTIQALDTEPLPPEPAPTAAPALTFTCLYANDASPFTCDTATPLSRSGFTGQGLSSQTYPQVGAEVVEQTKVRTRPTKSGDPATNTSGDSCGMIVLSESSVAGDDDVYLIVGQWENSVYRMQDDPNVESNYVDGEVEVVQMAVSAPAGWVIDFVNPNPVQDQVPAQTMNILVPRASGMSYHFRTADAMQFWFVVRRADAASEARGRHYMEFAHIAWPIGALGMDRNDVLGDYHQLAVDWGRLAIQNTSGPGVGWGAIKFVGDHWRDNTYGPAWANGWSTPDWNGVRMGWFHPARPGAPGASGNSSKGYRVGLIPWGGYWMGSRYYMSNVMTRCRMHMRDLDTGEHAWWWTTSRDTASGKQMSSHGGVQSTSRPWSALIKSFVATDEVNNSGGRPDSGDIIAPRTRAWNDPPPLQTTAVDVRLDGDETAIQCQAAIDPATPATGSIVVHLDSGERRRVFYSSWLNSAFFLPSGNPWGYQRDFTSDVASVGNTIEITRCDPDIAAIHEYFHANWTHLTGYYRAGTQDSWYCRRDFLAMEAYESIAAHSGRSISPQVADGNVLHEFSSTWSNAARLFVTNDPAYVAAHYQKGAYTLSTSGNSLSQSTRGLSRAFMWTVATYGIATWATRLTMTGQGAALASVDPQTTYASGNIMRAQYDYMEYITTPGGVPGTIFFLGGSPNPYSESTFGPTNAFGPTPPALPIGGEGAIPASNGGYHEDVRAAQTSAFQVEHFLEAMTAAERSFSVGGSNGVAADNSRAFRFLDWYMQGYRNTQSVAGGPDTMPYSLIGSMGPEERPSGTTPLSTLSLQDVLDGKSWWRLARVSLGESESFGWLAHSVDSWHNAYHLVQSSIGTDQDLYVGWEPWPFTVDVDPNTGIVTTAAAQQIVEYFTREGSAYWNASIESEMTSVNGGRRDKTLGNWASRLPYIAYLMNMYS